MPNMQLRRDDVIVGVDTHKDQHVAVLLDGLGGRLAELFVPATAAEAFGVKGTGSYGIGRPHQPHCMPCGRRTAAAPRQPKGSGRRAKT